MTITGIICPICKDLLYSLHVHDFRQCRCGTCFIDGGREYTRVGYLPGLSAKVIWVNVEFRDNQLYCISRLTLTEAEKRSR